MTKDTHITRILEQLGDGSPRSCHDIADAIGLTIQQVTKRLYELRKEGMVALIGVDLDTGRRLYQLANPLAQEAATAETEAMPSVTASSRPTPAQTTEPAQSQASGPLAAALHHARQAFDAYLARLIAEDAVLSGLHKTTKALEAAQSHNH